MASAYLNALWEDGTKQEIFNELVKHYNRESLVRKIIYYDPDQNQETICKRIITILNGDHDNET